MSTITEIAELQREIAYHGARSDIESFCTSTRHSGPYAGIWYDIEHLSMPDTLELVQKSARYLELLGLLLRHPHNRLLVRPLDAKP